MALRQVLVHKVVAKNKDFDPVLWTDLARGLVSSVLQARHLQTHKLTCGIRGYYIPYLCKR